jgi:hypothetical protein
MTDVAYLCHNYGSVHRVEFVPENLILVIRGPLRRATRIQPGFALRYQR